MAHKLVFFVMFRFSTHISGSIVHDVEANILAIDYEIYFLVKI